jgi:FkbM family methyltransferase
VIIFKKKSIKSYFVSFLDFLVNHYLHNRSNKLIKEGKKQLLVFAFDHIAHKINLNGIYEREELEILAEWIKFKFPFILNGTAVDIGANIGNHSIFFSSYFKKVISFEPNNRTYQALEANSKLSDNIETFNFGISDIEQSLILNINKNNIGGSYLSSTSEKNKENSHNVVKLFKLDSLVNKNDNITLIKIDVEGHEVNVLKGAEKIINECKPLILFELNISAFKNGISEEIEILKKYGYKKFATIESSPRFFNIGSSRFKRIVNFIYSKENCIIIKEDIVPANYYFIIAIPENL